MTDLLPFLPSDDDDDDGNDNNDQEQITDAANNPIDDDDNDDNDDNDDDDYYEVNDSFEFGGILGEDGTGTTSSNHLFTSKSISSSATTGWSYQKIIDEQQKAIDEKEMTTSLPRMDVNALIQAKRKVILQEKKKNKRTTKDTKGVEKKNTSTYEDLEEDDEQKNNNNTKNEDSESGEDDDNGNDDSSSSENDKDESDSSSSDSDDDDDDDNSVGDENNQPQDDDVVRTRELKIRKSKKKKTESEITNTKKSNNDDDDDDEDDSDNDDNDKDDHDDDEDDSDDEDDNDDKMEAAKAAAFFDNDNEFIDQTTKIEMFAQLAISRPILRGIAAMGFVTPTPIQAKVIPIALAGRDICASAVTGSGKTAAFIVPILERLIHRARTSSGTTRALILTPTRELAAQCISMMSSLQQFVPDIRSCLVVGGTKNVAVQAAELRSRPDIVVATPGRLLDHIMNSTGFTLDDIEYLVLDEADRLLDLGFHDEIMEILKACGGGNTHRRQTLLFSATMNTKVDDLVKLSLKRPVRVHVAGASNNNNNFAVPGGKNSIEVAPRLEQEFVRIRSSYNDGVYREAILLSLLTRTYTTQTIVFFDTKVTAHRLMIICGLFGIKCTELHGNLSQQQRLIALEEFRDGTVDILLATDLAARGLDIDRVKSVINYEMPLSVETYVHRIGRTARAGRSGRSCTLISEQRRHLMKDIIKDSEKNNSSNSNKDTKVIRSRVIPPSVVEHFATKIKSIEFHIEEVMQAEAVAKMDRVAEMELLKAQNMIEYENDIKQRPQREWFQSQRSKKLTKTESAERAKLAAEKAGTGMHKMTRKKRRAREALQQLKDSITGGDDDDDDDERVREKKRNKLVATTPVAIKAAAKQEKRNKLNQQANEKSISEQEQEREMKLLSKNKKKMKATIGQDPIGDSSLFNEEKIAHAPKKKKIVDDNGDDDNNNAETTPKSFYNFRGFDPNKKLGKKKGHKKFKSKSKYKRRK